MLFGFFYAAALGAARSPEAIDIVIVIETDIVIVIDMVIVVAVIKVTVIVILLDIDIVTNTVSFQNFMFVFAGPPMHSSLSTSIVRYPFCMSNMGLNPRARQTQLGE